MKTFKMIAAISLMLIGCSANGTATLNSNTGATANADAKRARINQQIAQNQKDLAEANGTVPAGTTPPVPASATPVAPPAAPKPNAKKPVTEPQLVASPQPVQTTILPRFAAEIAPGPKDVNGMFIIGFSAEKRPCNDNSYEQALMAIPSLRGYVRGQQPRTLSGRCMRFRRSAYWVLPRVDGVEMAVRYESSVPVSYCTIKNGETRMLPLTPPGKVPDGRGGFKYDIAGNTVWLMPSGVHTISYDLYEPAATGDCYQYVRTVSQTLTWPHQTDIEGHLQNEPEAYFR